MTKQVKVPFSIGRYKHEVLCDVVPKHVDNILLGRPRQFHKKVVYDGFLIVTLSHTMVVPVFPKEVLIYQEKLERKKKKENKSKESRRN